LISAAVMAVALAVALTVRLPTIAPVAGVQPKPRSAQIRISKIDPNRPDRIAEEIELRESVALYLPTRRNTSVLDELPANILQEPGSAYRPFPPKHIYSEGSFDLHFPELEPTLIRPADVLALGQTSNVLSSIGEQDVSLKPLSARVASLEVVDSETGSVAYRKEISKDLGGDGFPKGEWRPLELLVTVNSFGLVGTPTIVTGESSGSDENDAFFCNFLANRIHIENHLSPGVYAVRIGP
jgi:hypothetical protein